jgi:hypothetical protein
LCPYVGNGAFKRLVTLHIHPDVGAATAAAKTAPKGATEDRRVTWADHGRT